MKLFFIFLLSALFTQNCFAATCTQKNNAVSYEIEAELKTESEQIFGKEILKFTNHTCKNLDQIYLHLYPNAFRWEMDGTYAQEASHTEDPENHFLKYGKG